MGPDEVQGLDIFFTGLAWILTVAAITLYRWQFRRRKDVIKTKAYVVENIYRATNSVSYPVIEFTTEDGERHRYTSRVGSTPPRVKEDTYTTIFYLRNKPSKYIIHGGFTIYIFGDVFSLIGIIICVEGALNFFGKGYLVERVLNAIFG